MQALRNLSIVKKKEFNIDQLSKGQGFARLIHSREEMCDLRNSLTKFEEKKNERSFVQFKDLKKKQIQKVNDKIYRGKF